MSERNGRTSMDDDELFERLARVFRDTTDFTQASADILTLGKEYLGVDNGHIARIDPVTNYWETIGSSDPDSHDFPVGRTVDLGQTYCRRTIEEGDTIALHDASAQGWAHDRAYRTHRLDTYIGTPYTINGRLYGTVCFVSEDPRPEPFTETEIHFVEFLAQLVKRTLERKRQDEIIADKEEIISTLSRVLRHNLSNDLNVIHGHARMLEEAVESGDDHHVDVIEENAAALIDLAEKCRDLQTIVNSEHRRVRTDLESLLQTAVDDVRHEYPHADVSLECPAETSVNVLPVLEKAIVELVENGAKHATGSPQVEVTGALTDQTFEVRISDNGTGLPEAEQRVLHEGYDTPLAHGTGIGLWMVYWILQRHDGTVDVTATESGTDVDIAIPYATAKIPSEVPSP